MVRHWISLAALFVVAVVSACTPPVDRIERIIFSSNRAAGIYGGHHLWMVAPDGDPASLAQLTRGDVFDTSPRISPDGSLVAFARAGRNDRDNPRIWVRSLVTGAEWPVTSAPRGRGVIDSDPFWSPDGRRLGFARTFVSGRAQGRSELWILPLDVSATGVHAGDPVRFTPQDDASRQDGSWEPTAGTSILFMKWRGLQLGIWQATYPGGEERHVVDAGCCGAYFPRFSPDGERVAYVSYRANDRGDIFVRALNGPAPAIRVTCAEGWDRPDWSPDGRHLVVVSQDRQGLWRVPFPKSSVSCPSPLPVTAGAYLDRSPSWAAVAVLP